MTNTPLINENRILAGLPDSERERITPHLEPVHLPFGDVLHDTDDVISHVYFPTSAVVTLLRYTENGDTTEVALCGSEGIVGTGAFLGKEVAFSVSLVKRAGHAFRLSIARLREELLRHGRLEKRLLNYVQALVSQLAQMNICNRLHTVEQRLCRCLLQLLDQQESLELDLTHEFLAMILGVRRVGITEASGRLQGAGALTAGRGYLLVRDRAELEARSCECYETIRRDNERLLPSLAG